MKLLCSISLGVVLLFPSVVTTTLAGDERDRKQSVDVGLRKQLFVDDFLVARSQQITRRLGTVTKLNDGQPIFTAGRFYGTVLYDAGRFKLWYRQHSEPGYGYAESDDGIHFEKKTLLSGINFDDDYTLSVEIDPHESDPAHRYKAAYDAPGMAAGVAHSADGIHWTPYNNGRPVTGRAADTYNQILWDEGARTYRLFTRTDFGTAGGTGEVRGTRGMTNRDVKSRPADWKTARSWIFDREGAKEADRRQIYAMTDWIYHGVHFGLMSVYEWPSDFSEGPADLHKRHERDVMNFYIGTSRDAQSWDFSWVYAGQPLIPRGPEGAFDKDLLFPASTIVTHDDKHWLYYCGADERHGDPSLSFPRKMAIGVATLRLDGFVALEAGDQPGTIVTRPFRLDGTELLVNVDAKNGSVAVDLLDAAGKPIESFSGAASPKRPGIDALRWRPDWQDRSDLKSLTGQTVRLQFRLHNAKLYSFQIAGSEAR